MPRSPGFRLLVGATLALTLTSVRATAQYRGYEARVGRSGRDADARRSADFRSRASRGLDPNYGYGAHERFAPQRYAPDPRVFGVSPYGSGRSWRRGQYLPPDYRGASVADPGRYHLRVAPSGYGWVGDGRNAYLMQRSTGMVLDLVPRAYERPKPPRPRR